METNSFHPCSLLTLNIKNLDLTTKQEGSQTCPTQKIFYSTTTAAWGWSEVFGQWKMFCRFCRVHFPFCRPSNVRSSQNKPTRSALHQNMSWLWRQLQEKKKGLEPEEIINWCEWCFSGICYIEAALCRKAGQYSRKVGEVDDEEENHKAGSDSWNSQHLRHLTRCARKTHWSQFWRMRKDG